MKGMSFSSTILNLCIVCKPEMTFLCLGFVLRWRKGQGYNCWTKRTVTQRRSRRGYTVFVREYKTLNEI